jgi:predicted transcriptional regulator
VGLVGRATLVDHATRLSVLGGNVLLFGAEGSGRTALLHHIAEQLRGRGCTVHFVDGAGIGDPLGLMALIRRACGLGAGAGADVPSMLIDVSPPPEGADRVIVVDDLEVAVCIEGEIPEELVAGARGNPRELRRRARSFLLAQEASVSDDDGRDGSIAWAAGGSGVVDELSADEMRLIQSVGPGGGFSLSDPGFLERVGWSYAKVHRLANELVRRGVLSRADVPGEVGRPRVVYSPISVDLIGRSCG